MAIRRLRQTVERRSTKFFLAPSVVLFLSVLDLIWEIVRQNLPRDVRLHQPGAFTLLGVAPAAALSAGLIALLLGRGQFAIANRPLLGGASDGLTNGPLGRGWSVRLYNGGSGLASLYRYAVSMRYGSSVNVTEQVDIASVEARLIAAGLRRDVDFFLRILSPGMPLPPVKSGQEGIELFWFAEPRIAEIAYFEVVVEIVDIVGDRHQWRREFAEIKPTSAASATGRRRVASKRRTPNC